MTPDRLNPADIREKLQTRPIIQPPLIVPVLNGFQLDGWITPVGAVPGKGRRVVGQENLSKFLAYHCNSTGFELKDVIAGEDDDLQSFVIKCGNHQGCVELTGNNNILDKEYQFKGVSGGRVAIGLQFLLAKYARSSQDSLRFPYLGTSLSRGKVSYFPMDLRIPLFLAEVQQALTTADYQASLIQKALVMAQRLDLTINARDGLVFTNGLLKKAAVVEGNACQYDLVSSGEYAGHNVDTPNQAILLHWVCGTFIRDLTDSL
ncbi:MAG TPA: hypothetical protein VMX76_00410 [Nevskiaceae bacterium]|nr:hypothetical protein [Nevskiaceae bacterium]